MPKVTVTITETQTNNRFDVETDKQGDYVSPPLKVGTYVLSVEATGFKTYTQSGIVLNVQDRLRVDPQMEVGAAGRPDYGYQRSRADPDGDFIARRSDQRRQGG